MKSAARRVKTLFWLLLMVGFFRPLTYAQTGTATYQTLAGVEYLEVIKGSAPPGTVLPVLIVLHYYTSRPEEAAQDFTGLDFPVRLILPRGQYPVRTGFSFYPPGYYQLDSAAQAREALRALAPLQALVRALPQRYAVRGQPLVTGFSQGGDLSYLLALHQPRAVAAALPIAAVLHRSLLPKAQARGLGRPAFYVFHGQADTIVRIASVRHTVQRLRQRKMSVELREYPGLGHDISPEMVRDYTAVLRQLMTSKSLK